MRALSAAKALGRALRSRLGALRPRERAHKPDFSDRAMRQALARQADPALRAVVAASADAVALRRAVACHFRARPASRFFVSPAEAHALAAARPAPPWTPPQRPGLPGRYTEHDVLAAAAQGWRDLPNGPGQDILFPARPHRFASAPLLALAALHQPAARRALHEAVTGWQAYAERRGAMAYLSNLVVIQRLLALSWAWTFIASTPEAEVDDGFELEYRLLQVLRADVQFLLPLLGDSFPNNHLLADRFAGWYAHAVFPEFVGPGADIAVHDELFRRELQRQVLADGTGFEHSSHYHEFACEMAVAHTLLTRRRQPGLEPWSQARLGPMLRFQFELAGPQGHPIAIGNATEDPLFPLDQGQGWAPGAFRELYRALFDARVAAADPCDGSTQRAWWLLGGKMAERAVQHPQPGFAHFPDGGFAMFEEPDGASRLVFRTGPAPGTEAMAGHMHADLLSVTLQAAGRPLLVDPGTFSYRRSALEPHSGVGGWRDHLAGPQAHNAPAVGNADPLGPLTDDFRPRDAAVAVHTMAWRAGERLRWLQARIATPGPCEGLSRGVLHVVGAYWLLCDAWPEGSAPELRSSRFQFGVGMRVEQPAPGLVTVDGGRGHLLVTEGIAPAQVLDGSLHPRGGWVSPEYGTLVAAPQLHFSGGPAATLLQAGGQPALAVVHQALPGGGHACRIDHVECADYVLLAGSSQPCLLEAWGLRFEGVVLWLRLHHGGRAAEMRWLSGRRLQVDAADILVECEDVLDELHAPLGSAFAPDAWAWPAGVRARWPGQTPTNTPAPNDAGVAS